MRALNDGGDGRSQVPGLEIGRQLAIRLSLGQQFRQASPVLGKGFVDLSSATDVDKQRRSAVRLP